MQLRDAALITGDARSVMARLPDRIAHTCVTSPPYFGLRDYGCNGQIGLETTPDQFVEALVDVFREVRRVLRDDGTLWLNLGDSYARPGGTDRNVSSTAQVGSTRNTLQQMGDRTSNASAIGLKHKDLIGIPWRVAFALQADGWYLRQDIIWHKPNPMPESVRDRCTKAHEYIFLLSKSPRYYYDVDAIKEPSAASTLSRLSQPTLDTQQGSSRVPGKTNGTMKAVGGETRNKRSVWTVTTKPYKGAHFATFPIDLIEPCVLAGAPVGGIVLDPFSGSGTTGEAALKHGRRYIGIELNPEYQALARARLNAAT